MTEPTARPDDARGARHRAPGSRPGRLRPLLVAMLVVGVVVLAGLAATRLGPATTTEPSSVGASEASTEVSPAGPTAGSPAGPTAGSTAGPTAGSSSGASSGPSSGSTLSSAAAPPPAGPSSGSSAQAGAVLPGDPIPAPAGPLKPVDGVTPTVLRIPRIAVDVPLLGLGVQPDGAIEVPASADQAGWLTASAVPGRTGPAVLAGHVDSATGVAVFTRLGELAAGDEVEVGLSDGTGVRYVVTGSERYPKDAFPSADVYGPAPVSVLRLITCGGSFDRAAGSYEDNLVVYAVPAT